MAEDSRHQAVLAKANADAATTSESAAAAAAMKARQDAEANALREAAMAREESQRREQEAAANAAAGAAAKARADLTERLNRVLPTRETDRGIVAEISGVQIATGAATLNASAREALARFAGIVGVYPSLRLNVEGHTDSTGSYTTNQALSLQRAITVRDYLIAQEVAASTINVQGLGADQPVADDATLDGRARNRRVEIVLTGGPISVR